MLVFISSMMGVFSVSINVFFSILFIGGEVGSFLVVGEEGVFVLLSVVNV